MTVRTETYLHELAKGVISSWWKEQFYFGIVPVRIDEEIPMSYYGHIRFIPDLVIYDFQGIRAFCEIEHTHPVDHVKLWEIDIWCGIHRINPLIIQIQADWVMKRVTPPEALICEVLSGVDSLVITGQRALIHIGEYYESFRK